MRLGRAVCVVLVVSTAIGCRRSEGQTGGGDIEFYRLRAPGDTGDIEQASDLHWGQLGTREGLWLVCDRNGGESAGRLFFISVATLSKAKHAEGIIADEAFSIVPPEGEWSSFAAGYRGVPQEVLTHVRERIESGLSRDGGPKLDLEAVTIGPSPGSPSEQRLFVVAEEPYSVVLELAIGGSSGKALARLRAIYWYQEADDEHGSDFNDGLEGLAYAGRPGEFYWAEEGTVYHGGWPGPQLFFLDPRLGRGRLEAGRLVVDRAVSERLTKAVRAQRVGQTQTLNAVTMLADGRLLAVDRNGGWILRVDPAKGHAVRWLNLYDLRGTNLREALAEFPGQREMPYISIEGIAVDREGSLWLVDDPAMPESFRASCLVRIKGLNLPRGPQAGSSPG